MRRWLLIGVALLLLGPPVRADSSRVLLPAYSHNDYLSPRPLEDALELGYRGVEVDYFLVDGQLLVGHERSDLRPDRSLEALYLAPLLARVRAQGTVHPDGAVFTVNIEAKEEEPSAYDALRDLLARYAEMLTVVRDGLEEPGPVQVVLVGWSPPLEELAEESPRYVSVHRHYGRLPRNHEEIPAHLLRMISVEYHRKLHWTGFGSTPLRFKRIMSRIRKAKEQVPGRILRVFRVPRTRKVYLSLLASGTDLIGTSHLRESREIFLDVLHLPELQRE